MIEQNLAANLKFLDGQRLLQPSLNAQVDFDFQGLRQSFYRDAEHPNFGSLAEFGRIWIYDIAVCIYADLKAGRLRQAGYQAGRVMQLARQEEAKGYKGLWHFSYNTLGDSFIDPRGPAGANAWVLNALYAYVLEAGDTSILAWLNEAVERYLFELQVMDKGDKRYGLIRAGYYNSDEMRNEEDMGYHVYEGMANAMYAHVILEHCVDALGTLRLAYRATKQWAPDQAAFLGTLQERHDLLMQAVRKAFWHKDHFVSALDDAGNVCLGTDGQPSIAVDNNTWAAHVVLPYDIDAAKDSARYIEEHFVVPSPPASIEGAQADAVNVPIEGTYYFPSTFADPFVQVEGEDRKKLEQSIHPEATLGYCMLLLELGAQLPDEAHYTQRAQDLYQTMVQLQNLYGEYGAPYASADVPGVFSTLSSVITAATSVVVGAALQGVRMDDFIGVLPHPEMTVAGQPPQISIEDKA